MLPRIGLWWCGTRGDLVGVETNQTKRASISASMLRLPLSVTGKESGTQLVCLVCGGPETGDSLSHFL